VVGVAGVVKSGYPDPAQFDPESDGYDGKSSQDNPRWFCVDVAFQRKFTRVLTMQELKQAPALMDMVLFRQGRLSVQPVTAAEWRTIMSLAESL
jgi:predicted RNA-binding protein with PUA-like domain